MKASATCHGAGTIANAIATGKGAAFGISLETRAHASLNDKGTFRAIIDSQSDEDTTLMILCAKKVLDHLRLPYGADIRTESDIPIAAGLKSSSTAANAVALATMEAAIRSGDAKKIDDLKLIRLAVEAAVEANVTVTGAFDDAAASYFGGYVITDNAKRRIIKKGKMDESLHVIIHVPEKRRYTAKVDVSRMKLLSSEVMAAWDLAKKGKLFTAINTNGLLYSAALGEDPNIPLAALEAGAVAAGLSGKGPAVIALTRSDPEKIVDVWQAFEGKIIQAEINNRKARVLK